MAKLLRCLGYQFILLEAAALSTVSILLPLSSSYIGLWVIHVLVKFAILVDIFLSVLLFFG